MPTTSFSIDLPEVTPERAWHYVRDYANAVEWAANTVGVTPVAGADFAWTVQLARWPALEMICERHADDNADWRGCPRTVRFDLRNNTGAVRCTEEFHIRPHGQGGCILSYTMLLGLRGWRRLPCMGFAVWVHLKADAARTRASLERQLKASVATIVDV